MITFCQPCKGHGLVGIKISLQSCKVTLERFVKTACDFMEEDYNDIVSEKRTQSFINTRHMIMAYLYKNTKFTLVQIANAFNKKNHATIIHANKKVKDLCETEINYRTIYSCLSNHLDKLV